MRFLGYTVINFIQLIRYFGFGEACKIIIKLVSPFKSSEILIKSSKFRNPVFVRKAKSDLPIFLQVFSELQYDISWYLDFSPRTIIDAGANVGYGTLYFANLFPDARIVSIEPEICNHAQLVKNVKLYKNVTVLNGGIWYESGYLKIKSNDVEEASFEVEPANESANSSIRAYTIHEVAELHQFDSIDILKMDIEGAEYFLFLNNPDEWLKNVRCLIIELHDNIHAGTSKEFFKVMSNYNWFTVVKSENIICFKK
jgi:FkbM family methyltransferase